MSTSTPSPRCACSDHTVAEPRPTNFKPFLSNLLGIFTSSKNVVAGAKGAVELSKALLLPAIGFGAKGVTKGSLAARIQATIYDAKTRGIFSALQSLGAKAPPPPSPARLLVSALCLPYGAWQLYKLLASDGNPNPELWQRRVECSCDGCECAEGCACACRRRVHSMSQRLLNFLRSSTFVDCCFSAALLAAGIAFAQPWGIVAGLWEIWRSVMSIKENFLS